MENQVFAQNPTGVFHAMLAETPKTVVFIPYWIKGMLERRNLPLNTFLDFKVMKQILSLEEQSVLLQLQSYSLFDPTFDADGYPIQYPYPQRGTDITEWYGAKFLEEIWRKSVAANDLATKDLFHTLSYIGFDNTAKKEIEARLFCKESFSEQHKEPFITYDLTRDIIGVVVYPGYFNRDKFSDFRFPLLKSILKVLYVYNSYASVCKTPYFRKYLEELVRLASMSH